LRTVNIYETYMSRCLELAHRAMGRVSPNPMVGAVLVHEELIIGEGYHQCYGGPHAEVHCIASVKGNDRPLIAKSTLYVGLEPCSHHGKTPPCTDLIIDKGIKQVVIGSHDPNPLVAGKGIKKLIDAGIEVKAGVLERECDFLNRRFMTFYKKKRPYIILKWAESADGFMAPDGDNQVWLTGDYSRKLVHKWRTEEDAILVGTRTALIDDPQLTARDWEGKSPIRVLIDMDLKVPLANRIFDDQAMTIVYNAGKEGLESGILYVRIDQGESRQLPSQYCSLILDDLYRRSIQSIIIEGGAYTLKQFIDQNLWDEARVFSTPTMLHTGIRSPLLTGNTVDEKKIGNDIIITKMNYTQ